MSRKLGNTPRGWLTSRRGRRRVEVVISDHQRKTESSLLEISNLRIMNDLTNEVIVDDASFSVGHGETVALVGESGSGKSITAKAIIGLLPKNVRASGTIKFDGRELLKLSAGEMRGVRGAEIGMILQDPFTLLNPMITAGAHIAETLQANGRRENGKRLDIELDVQRRLAEVGIERPGVASRYPFELSGGMRQRVGIAAAISRRPQLLIADEPTTALDATTQQAVLRLLREIQRRRSMALLLITHDLRIAFAMADRVLVVYAGRLLETGKPAKLRRAPAHPYTFGLLKAMPAMDHTQRVLPGIPGNVPSAVSVQQICAFASRCKWVQEACTAGRPPLRNFEFGHSTACIRFEELESTLTDLASDRQSRQADAASPSGEARLMESTYGSSGDASEHQLLLVRGLVKTFSSRRGAKRTGSVNVALEGVDLDLNYGQSVGVVGETGSGKSTLARCLLGLERPSHGSIVIDGVDVSNYKALSADDLRRVRNTIQCVFQDPYSSLNPSHTVRFALAEAIVRRSGGHRMSRAEVSAEVSRLLSQVGLPANYSLRRPIALSGGERQRVAIARALAPRPRVLLCDEPVAALDVSVQAQVLEVLRSIHDEGVSLLFITHDLAVVRQMTERLIVLHKGVIVETGETIEVLEHPQNDYTKLLVQAAPTDKTTWLL